MIIFLKLIFKGIYRFLTDKTYRRFYWLVLKHGGKARFTPYYTTFYNKPLKIADSLSFIWQYHDIFREGFYNFNSKDNHPLIYDIGSNIGLSIIYFKMLYPGSTIKAFEPDKNIVEILTENISKQVIDPEHIEINECAVWINDDGISMISDKADGAKVIHSDSISGTVKVKTVRLRSLLEKEEYIHFMKMDIEGAESEVLQDCEDLLYKINQLFIEFHSLPGEPQKLDIILSILRKNKFRYQIHSPFNYKNPFIRKELHKPPHMDLQINIFAFKYD